MRTPIALLGAALAALPLLFAAALPEPAAVDKGYLYIAGTQQPDGGFGGFGAGHTFDAVYAIRAAGIDPKTVTNGGASPADYLEDAVHAADLNAPTAAKAVLAAHAMGLDPLNVDGVNLIARIKDSLDGETGLFAPGDAFSHSIVILGQVCIGRTGLPLIVYDALVDQQLEDGGWGFAGASDPDTTAIAVQALVAGDAGDAAVAKAVAYLADTQGTDGGWGFDPTASNASSTAYVVQAILALGQDPEGAAWIKDGKDPVAFLRSQQQEDGSFIGFDPAFATNQVVPALAGRTFCDAPETPLRTGPAPTPTATATPSATATATATPSATATATAPATSTATAPAATQTAAPRPPSTGTGRADEGGAPWTPVAAAMLGLAGIAALAARRGR
ncbi:MAG: terpene cyclase/mutase family protein [Dehalococcoidia bacterium]|nr:terpene cyclase/mutase family protein [Dehalococcoidia bacterium]